MHILVIGSSFAALLRSCIAHVFRARRWVIPPLSITPPNLLSGTGIAAPGRWGHHSPLPQYRLGKTSIAAAKRRARKTRYWQGVGHGDA